MRQSFELRRGDHAIAEFHASVELFRPVNGGVLSRVHERLKRLAADFNLPAAMPIQVFQFVLGDAPSPQPATGGFGYQRFAPTGEVAMSLVCDANSILLTLRDYQGWAQVRPVLIKAFSTLLREYMIEVPAIQSVRLQYSNEFRAVDETVTSADDLFSADSQWLAPFMRNCTEDWHCNVGRYIAVDSSRRDLVNVNSSVVRRSTEASESQRLYANATIVAGCYFNIPGHSPLVLTSDDLEDQVIAALDDAHSLEKRILAEMLSSTYLSAVGASHDD